MSWYPPAMAGALALTAVLLARPAGVSRAVRSALAKLRPHIADILLAVILALLFPLLARRYMDVTGTWVFLASSTVAFVSLLMIGFHFSDSAGRLTRWLESQSPARIAGMSFAIALVACLVVLESFPHVSDEVAYQFQARTMASGRLYLPAPPEPADALTFIHTFVDGDKWYGIMNPGWPVFLAVGYASGLPWLINPVLGALTLLVLAGFLREAGMTRTVTRYSVLLLVISPFVIFMNGTFMSHPANLLLFMVFCWAWARLLRTGTLAMAVVAGIAVGWNLLVRPVDTAAVTLPFVIHGIIRMTRDRRLLVPVILSGIIGVGGIAATMAYDKALTGDAMVMPVTRYFEDRNPNERFGIGFGDDMGTTMHGDEWPGFHPPDAVRVTAYRIAQFARDLYGLPLLVFALPFVVWRRRRQLFDEWTLVLTAAAVSLTVVYFFHFYHGVAYGSRHLYLALPAVTLLLAKLLVYWMHDPGAGPSGQPRVARAAFVALILQVMLFTLPPLVREYADEYRGSSSIVRKELAQRNLANAIVLVHPGNWAWKSTFPLNEYPLERNAALFALDRPETRNELLRAWPGRTPWTLRITDGQVILEPLR